MDDKHLRRQISRRKVIAAGGLSVGSLGLASACTPQPKAATTKSWDFDISQGPDAVKLYAKLTGSTAEREVYLQYFGQIISLEPGKKHVPILGLKGLVRLRWSPNPDGSYSHSNYDQGLFCDFDSGKVLNTYQNPLTGDKNTPLHYRSGPLVSTIGLGEGQENPLKKNFRVNGNQVTASGVKVGEFTNPVSPDKWGKASTGEKVAYSYTSTYYGDKRELADATLDTVDCDHYWSFMANYPAWMMMGSYPGVVNWTWAARKFSNPNEIDPYIRSEVLDRVPGFFTDDKPWPERSDGWTQYSRERAPL